MLDALYGISGDVDMGTFARTYVMFFSTKLAEDNNLGDLYDYYRNGTWTYDTMSELAAKVAKDVDGNSQMDIANDIWGMGSHVGLQSLLITTTGYSFTDKTNEGAKLTGITETLLGFHEKLLAMNTAEWSYSPSSMLAIPYNEFTEDRVLFLCADISNAAKFSGSMTSYGILPAPKYTVDQEDHITFCRAAMTGIPTSSANIDAAAATIEALNYYSTDTVRATYIDKALSYKYASSPDVTKIISTMFDNVACDFVQPWYDVFRLSIHMHNSVGNPKCEHYASWYDAIKDSVNANLDSLFASIAEIKEQQSKT